MQREIQEPAAAEVPGYFQPFPTGCIWVLQSAIVLIVKAAERGEEKSVLTISKRRLSRTISQNHFMSNPFGIAAGRGEGGWVVTHAKPSPFRPA